MANSIKERPLDPIFAELAKMGAQPNGPLWEYFRTLVPSTDKTITNKGEIQAVAPVKGRTEGLGTTVGGLANTGDILAVTKVVGRTEGLGTTVGQLNSSGQLVSTDQIAADGTGSPLTGGKRGFVALDTNNRLADSFKNTPANVSNIPTSSTTLSNDGVSHAIVIAASSAQFPPGTVAYNSGSVDPGVFGTKQFVYVDDPTFAGGAVTYAFTASIPNLVGAEGRTLWGSIVTSNGTPKTGGGFTGGNSGSSGGRGFFS